ncbi:hypothetical protein MS6207_01280 [Escherichia coli]|nr:hypothetical protein [Escherichia coli]
MQDYLLESLKLQRIDFFHKVGSGKRLQRRRKAAGIQWVSELTDELMAKNPQS